MRTISVNETGWYIGVAFTNDSAFVDSIYVLKGPDARVHELNVCTFPKEIECSFVGTGPYLWSTGAKTKSIQISHPGTYWCSIQLSADCYVSDTFNITLLPTPIIALPEDTQFCAGDNITLDASHSAYKSYQWSTGDTLPYLNINQPGTYRIIALTFHQCMFNKTIIASYLPQPIVKLPNDSAFCIGELEKLVLDAGNWKSYYWYPNGETTQTIKAVMAAQYKVVVTDSNNCRGTDEVSITEECPEEIYIPNVFTPNSNGLNDVFEPIGRYIKSYQIEIINRWGEVVYKGNTPWNGNIKNYPADIGVYIYIIDIEAGNKIERREGTITLIR